MSRSVICEICGGCFALRPHSSRNKRCSDACRRIAMARYMRQRRDRVIPIVKCIICNVQFLLVKTGNKKTCSPKCARRNKTVVYRAKVIAGRYRHLDERYRAHRNEYGKRWAKLNKHRLNQYQVLRRKNSIDLRLKGMLRQPLRRVAIEGGSSKYIGYSTQALRAHIESLFSKGMSWDNYGRCGWHIDHIKPLSAFRFFDVEGHLIEEAVREAFGINNLQPLWAHDNYTKHTKFVSKEAS